MNDPVALTSTGAHSADDILKPLEKAVHKAGAAVGAEAVPCEIAEPFLAHIKGHDEVTKIPMTLLPKLAQEIRNKFMKPFLRLPAILRPIWVLLN